MTVSFKTETLNKNRPLADSIKENLKLHEGSLQEDAPHKAYNDNLPNGLTVESVKELAKYNNAFIRATHLAVAEKAAEVFNAKGNQDVNNVTAKVGFLTSTDSLKFNVERSHDYPNPRAADGEPNKVTKHLVISMEQEVRGMAVKSVKDAISAEFKERFVK